MALDWTNKIYFKKPNGTVFAKPSNIEDKLKEDYKTAGYKECDEKGKLKVVKKKTPVKVKSNKK